MTTPDTTPPVAGDGITSLSADDVKKIITDTQNSQLVASDPVSVAMRMFSGLGDKAIVSGASLRAALSDAAVPLAGQLAAVMDAIQSVTKTGNLVTLTNSQDVQIEINGTQARLKNEVSFEVTQGDTPTLSNIKGVAVHKMFWIDIHSIQLRQDQGKKIVSVATSAGTKEFPVG
jgi:hypothetical protein